MSDRTPAEELTAAEKLDALLNAATPGPWQMDGPHWHDAPSGPPEASSLVTSGEDRDPVLLGMPPWVARDRGEHNLRYAAAMGPQVGAPLVAFLRGLAEFYAAQGWTEWPSGTERLRDLVRGILATKETP